MVVTVLSELPLSVIPVIIDAVTTNPSPMCLDQEGVVTVSLVNNTGYAITGFNSIPVALNGVRNGVYYPRTVIGEEVMTQKIVVNY